MNNSIVHISVDKRIDKLKERLRHTTSSITNRFSSADSSPRKEAAPTKETEVAPTALTKEEEKSETLTDEKTFNM